MTQFLLTIIGSALGTILGAFMLRWSNRGQ